jgi:hypothetical protein
MCCARFHLLNGRDVGLAETGLQPWERREYNATTGAAINASFITGLSEPEGLAVSGNDLFVVNTLADTVGEYNATTGAVINANFITGLLGPGESRCRATPSS